MRTTRPHRRTAGAIPASTAAWLPLGLLLVTAAAPLRAQQSASQAAPQGADWPAPPQASSRYIRVGATQDRFPDVVALRPLSGVEVGMGSGHGRRFGVGADYGFALGRGEFYGTPGTAGQLLGLHRADVRLMPRLAGGDRSALLLQLAGGARLWTPYGGAGLATGTSVWRWGAGAGLELRHRIATRASLSVIGRHDWTPMRDGEFTVPRNGTLPATTVRGQWRLGLGLAFHDAPVRYDGLHLDRYPRGEAAPAGTLEPLAPAVGRVLGHVDGAAPLSADGRANTRYTGPQKLTVFFKGESADFVDEGDHGRLVALGQLLAEVPGTILVLRAFDAPAAAQVPARQAAERRAERLRSIVLSAAPFVNPQRVTIIPVGADFSVKDEARGRRVEVEFFRP